MPGSASTESGSYTAIEKALVRRNVARYHMQLSADLAKSFVPVESLIGFSVPLTQRFNLLHFLVVFFRGGKKCKQPCFECVIHLRCFGEKFLPSRT